jgi:hypothetical protein
VGDSAAVPTVAEHDTDGIGTVGEQVSDIVGLVGQTVVVVGPTRAEAICGDGVAVDLSVVKAQGGDVEAGTRYTSWQVEGAAQ